MKFWREKRLSTSNITLDYAGWFIKTNNVIGGTVGLIDGLVSKDKPSDVIKKNGIWEWLLFASHLGFNLLSKGTKVKNLFKSGKNAEDKFIKMLRMKV